MTYYASFRPMRMTLILLIAWSSSHAWGQSSSRYDRGAPPLRATSQPNNPQGSGSANRTNEMPVALHGFCPVCLVDMRQWINGDPRFAVQYDGKQYLFPGQEQVEKFQQNPLQYVPALGGDDVVHFSRTRERIAGSLSHGVIHNGRTYFFASSQNKQLFQSNPAAYENVDLALGGDCVVCRADLNRQVSGRSEFTVLYNGLHFWRKQR